MTDSTDDVDWFDVSLLDDHSDYSDPDYDFEEEEEEEA